MGSDGTGRGDPARTLELLWRTAGEASPRRGPRRGLSVDEVVGRATELADADGLDKVTMRRLAESLDVAPMTLYNYVPSKGELLDLMLDDAYLRMRRTPLGRKQWRAGLEAVADDNRALYAQHPWAAAVSTGRPPLGPGQMAKYEHELSPLEGHGLSDVELDAALTFVLDFVQSSALAEAQTRSTKQESGLDEEEWWATAGPLLARMLDTAAYPRAVRVGGAAGAKQGAAYNPDAAYRFGIQRVLDGLGVLIDRRSKSK